jgi:hypothetical protein
VTLSERFHLLEDVVAALDPHLTGTTLSARLRLEFTLELFLALLGDEALVEPLTECIGRRRIPDVQPTAQGPQRGLSKLRVPHNHGEVERRRP